MKTLKDLLDAYDRPSVTGQHTDPSHKPGRIVDLADLERFARSQGYELRVEMNVAAYNDKVRKELDALKAQRKQLDAAIEAKSREFAQPSVPDLARVNSYPEPSRACRTCGAAHGLLHAPRCDKGGRVSESDL